MSDAPIVEHDGEILYGSSTLPASFEIGGEVVALGAIVVAAFAASGLTEEDWNALPDADRDAKLQTELSERGYVAPDAAGTPPATVESADPHEAEEPLHDAPPPEDAVSAAPARPHDSLVDQLEMRWNELLDFVRTLEGDVEGRLGEVLALARSHL